MKTRIISALVALLIFVPIIMTGGTIYNIAIFIIAILGLKEFLDIKSSKKDIPETIQFVSYMMLSLLVLFNTNIDKSLIWTMDYRIIAGLFLTFLIPTVLYPKEKYSIQDAFYLIGGIFFLGTTMSLFILFRQKSLWLVIYLLLVTIITDTYAYLTGYFIGKHKLLEKVSPKKTLEGMVGGTIFGVLVSSVFYHTVINPELSWIIIITMSLFLSIIGQFGDLVFSSIKRFYGKKDFSNIMPGHGGILDRIDSIIFVVLGYIFFMGIL